MQHHLNLTDLEFETQFKYCTLNPEIFNHEAHLRLAWIHVTKYGEETGIKNICNQLINFVKHVGARDKYNETLTIAAIKAVNHFIHKSTSDNFKDFIMEFPRLKNNFKDLMSQHYKIDIFNSENAKQEYLEPDLMAFE